MIAVLGQLLERPDRLPGCVAAVTSAAVTLGALSAFICSRDLAASVASRKASQAAMAAQRSEACWLSTQW
jgi:hypothetical protein